MDFKIEEQHTHLEKKLEVISDQVRKYALVVAALSVVTHFFFLVLYLLFSDAVFISNASLLKMTEVVIIALIILIVAIPEGLPLAVSLAMALSTDKLKKDNILIKNIESIQKCAMVHDICISKTGCLTDADMVVAKYQIGNNAQTNDHVREIPYYDSFVTRLEVSQDIINIMIEAMIANSDVRIEIAERRVEDVDNYETEFVYEPCGQELEVALIKFLYDSNLDVQQRFIRRNRRSPKLAQLPFDQILKRKTVVR